MAGHVKLDFHVWLSQIRRGAFVLHCAAQLAELTKAMFEHDGDGEMQITFKFKNKGDGQVVVTPKVKIKKPTAAVGEAIFYTTVDGDLEREDPRQGALDLKLHNIGTRKKEDDN